MKIKIVTGFILFGLLFSAGCAQSKETMVLLDEPIKQVDVSKTLVLGSINEDIQQTFTKKKDIKSFESAITNAVKQEGVVDIANSDFDVVVHYKADLPAHALHLWLNNKDKTGLLMYTTDTNTVYKLRDKDADALRQLLFK